MNDDLILLRHSDLEKDDTELSWDRLNYEFLQILDPFTLGFHMKMILSSFLIILI